MAVLRCTPPAAWRPILSGRGPGAIEEMKMTESFDRRRGRHLGHFGLGSGMYVVGKPRKYVALNDLELLVRTGAAIGREASRFWRLQVHRACAKAALTSQGRVGMLADNGYFSDSNVELCAA